jgi:hypothetical protein
MDRSSNNGMSIRFTESHEILSNSIYTYKICMNGGIKRIFSTQIQNCNRSKSNGNQFHSRKHNSSASPYDMESYLEYQIEYQKGSNFYLIISLLHY